MKRSSNRLVWSILKIVGIFQTDWFENIRNLKKMNKGGNKRRRKFFL